MKFFEGNRKYILIFGILIILIIWQSPVRSFFYSFSRPASQWLWQRSENASSFFTGWLQANRLQFENQQIKTENLLLLSKLTELHRLEEENQKLREALGVGMAESYELLEARIFAQKDEDVYLINKGKQDGISKGMPVITFENVLVGRVANTYQNTSSVQLISHQELKFSVKIQGEEIKGLAQGGGKKKLSVGLIPKEQPLQKGQIFITDAPKGGFPPGLLVGEVENIKRTDLDAFQEAEILPFFTLTDYSSLLVIVNLVE